MANEMSMAVPHNVRRLTYLLLSAPNKFFTNIKAAHASLLVLLDAHRFGCAEVHSETGDTVRFHHNSVEHFMAMRTSLDTKNCDRTSNPA